MSTVAWDGKNISADKQVTAGTLKFSVGTKLRLISDGRVCGGTGTYTDLDLFVEWVEHGKAFEPDDDFEALVVSKDGAHLYDVRLRPIPVQAPFAIGSGSDFAIGAMAAGASASKAVGIATQYNPNTGFGVDSIRI